MAMRGEKKRREEPWSMATRVFVCLEWGVKKKGKDDQRIRSERGCRGGNERGIEPASVQKREASSNARVVSCGIHE
jgi:hypothetical protein